MRLVYTSSNLALRLPALSRSRSRSRGVGSERSTPSVSLVDRLRYSSPLLPVGLVKRAGSMLGDRRVLRTAPRL